MEKKVAAFQNKGMIRDTSISKASNELAFENFNIRVTARDHDTLLSVTNERGNLPIDIRNEKTDEGAPELLSIDGILIGYSVLNNYLVLFTTGETNDHIYRICYHALEDPEWTGRELYSGDLNFNVENPIEALSNYESEGVQKVYWVDGLNLPRFINIADSQLDSTVNRNGLFDFIIKVDKYPALSVTKQFVGSSTIPSGVLQYVCTYSNEGGQETNITYRSPLYYSSFYDRGTAADIVPNNSFSIEISNMSTLFDYINIYRVMRTSENGTATAARVAKLRTSEMSITYVDNGTSLAEIDPTALLYIGGRSIIPNTLSQKDNTLFLGNYTVDTAVSDPDIEEAVASGRDDEGYNRNLRFNLSTPEMGIPYVEGSGYYPYNCLLNYSEGQIKTFKGGEKYRIGIRFMKDTGELSPVYWIGDQENSHYPAVDVPSERIARAYLTYKIPQGLIEVLHDKGYTHAELLMAEASNSDRKILAQGIVCPTLFNLRQRFSNSPFAVSSWYFRPINGTLPNLHFSSLGTSDTTYGELQCSKPLAGRTGVGDKGGNSPTPYATTDYFGTNYLSMRYRIEVYNDKTWPGIIWQRNIRWILEYSASPVEEAASATDWTYIDSGNNIGTNWGRIFEKFVRPALQNWGFEDKNIPSEGTFVQWVENDTGYGGWRTIGSGGPQTIGTLRGSMGYDYSNVFSPYYFVDESICTFHSPECANGRSNSFDSLNCGFRIVGIAPLSSTMSDYDLTVEGNRMNSSGGLGILNLNQPIGSEDLDGLITLPLWQDAVDPENLNVMRTFWIYPWHKTGSIINNGDYDRLESKHEANLRFSFYTNYLFADNPWTPPNGIGAVRASNSDEAQLLSLDTQWGTKTYQATGDWVLSMSSVYPANADLTSPNVTVDPLRDQGYFVYMTGTNVSAGSSVEAMKQQGEFIPFPEDGAANPNKRANRCYDPVNISYRSTEHLVFSFKAPEDAPGDIVTLPYIRYTKGLRAWEYHKVPDIKDKNKTYLPWVEQVSGLEDAVLIYVFPYDEETVYFTQVSYIRPQLRLQVPYSWFDDYESNLNSASWITTIDTLGDKALYDKFGQTFTPVKTPLPAPWNIVISAVEYNEESGEVSATIRFSKSSHSNSTRIYWIGAGRGSISTAASSATLNLGTIPFTEAGVSTFNIQMQTVSSNSNYWNDSTRQSVGTVTLTITSTETEEGGPVLSWSTSSEVTHHPSTPQETDNIIITGVANPASEAETYTFEINGVTYLYNKGDVKELGIQEFDYYRSGVTISSEDFDIDIPFFYVAELYNTFEDSEGKVHDTRYGGISDAAVQTNTFIPISSPVKLWENNKDGSRTDITEISAYSGDTYVSRYDILKTLPYSDSSENSITEIASVLLETHINVDGRTDTNRGNSSMLGITEENFNIYNDVYSSDNNFFSGAVLSSLRFSTNIFPSQITWTLTKTPNEEIDTWTNITLASVLDMDGDKGPVRAIRRYQNSLIAFQDKGIAEILFNSRTQLATTEGVPIEIANSGRVDGKRYITDKAGCINKWSIVETSRGIYFIDNINSSISVFNGSVQSLSDAKGFKDWIGRNNSTDLWNPRDFNNFISFWDRINDDVYFLRGNEGENHDVLCYNEQLQQFVSFYNYGKVPMMVNVQDKFVAFKPVNTGDGTAPDKYLWKQGEGLYSHIFNEYQNFYTLYRVTPEPYSDKTFTNLTYRADMFDMNRDNDFMPGEGLLTGNTFDTLEVWNEYQGNKVNLKFTVKDLYPDKRRKFRIWRMDIPRDRKGEDNPYGLNRIRNPWIYLKLEKDNTNLEEGHNERMELHDLAVSYFE